MLDKITGWKPSKTDKLYDLLYNGYMSRTNLLLTVKYNNKTDVLINFRESYRRHKEGLCGKNVCRPAALSVPNAWHCLRK